MSFKNILVIIIINISLLACSDTKQTDEDSTNNQHSTFKWKIATTWGKDLPILADAVKSMTKEIELMSKGQIQFEILAAGQVVDKHGKKIDSKKLWEAVSNNEVQMMHSASYYWIEDIPGSVFFCALPFGMTYSEMNGWFNNSNGLELWRDLYDDYNLIPFACGGSGNQMGGWFNKRIDTITDYEGLKMRIPGLGGKVIEKAGATSISIEQIKIKRYLEEGYVDAAEWIGPFHDYVMHLNEVGRYYYEPGWQEPNDIFELTVNKNAYESLPLDLQEIIKTISYKYNTIIYNSFIDKNIEYRKVLENKNTKFLSFSPTILEKLKEYSKKVIKEHIDNDQSNKSSAIYDSYFKYQTDRTIVKVDSSFSPKNNMAVIASNNNTSVEKSFWDNLDNVWGVIGICIGMLTILITGLFQIQKQRRFKKMLLQANNLLKDYFEGKETSEKISDLRATIGHFLETHSIKEIQYNVLSNKISEIQNIIDSKYTLSDELKNDVEDIIADNIITEKEYHHLIHLMRSKENGTGNK